MRGPTSSFFVAAGWVGCALVGCGGGLPESAISGSTAPVDVVTPAIPRASFAIVPAELADPGVLDKIRHRTRLRGFGSAWIKLDAEPIAKRESQRRGKAEWVMPVIDERGAKIRIVTEDDDARLAVWIERDDTWSSIAATIELADHAGHASPRAGAWLTIGAPVEISAHASGRGEVQLHDDAVQVAGWVPSAVLSHVWLVPSGDRTPTDHDFNNRTRFSNEPPQGRTPAKIVPQTPILAMPRIGAGVIATTVGEELRVGIVAKHGAYTEIEIVRPHARIHGFVQTTTLSPSDDPSLGHGSGTGSGFGMSHADRIDVPAGTCLFDGIEGEVTGVQLAPTTRLGHRKTEQVAWSLVYVGNLWSAAPLYVRNIGDDPQQPRWESCTQPVHR